MQKAIDSLPLSRPRQRQETTGGARLKNIHRVKQQLLDEVVELEKQRDRLAQSGAAVDFSMMQTYKEMIHSRKVFFNELSH